MGATLWPCAGSGETYGAAQVSVSATDGRLHPGEHTAGKDRRTEAAAEKDREKWMARFQVKPAMQPGVDRAVVLQGVKEVTAHCAAAGGSPRSAFGDPDARAVQVATGLVPTDRAARERRRNAVVDALDVLGKAGDVATCDRLKPVVPAKGAFLVEPMTP